MARSLSNANLISALIAKQVSLAATRRGYAAAAQGLGSAMRGGGVMGAKKAVEESSRSSPWVPDPVTGYYRPENHGNDVDVAELRELLLKNKISRHH